MSRAPRLIKQSDLMAIVKAVELAGKQVARVDVDKDGKISIFVVGRDANAPAANPWEQLADEEISLRSKL